MSMLSRIVQGLPRKNGNQLLCRWLGTNSMIFSRPLTAHTLRMSNSLLRPTTFSQIPSLLLFGERIHLDQQRSFASPRKFRRNKKDTDKVPSNERLISLIMSKSKKKTSPEKVMVRLVIDEGPTVPATVSVVSLAEAIQVSVDRMTDLIGTSLDSDPPVIRATQLSKLQYQKQQSQQKGNAKAKQQQKSFRFRAGIGDHDLERKIADIIKVLDNGGAVDYTVLSKARLLRANPNAGMDLVERIQVLLTDFGQVKRPPKANETGNFIRVQLEPKKSSKS